MAPVMVDRPCIAVCTEQPGSDGLGHHAAGHRPVSALQHDRDAAMPEPIWDVRPSSPTTHAHHQAPIRGLESLPSATSL